MSDKEVTACIIIIGNEILSGRTQDKNTHWLAGELTMLGINTIEARVVPDELTVMVDAVRECKARADYVFTTGGIGPTHDDMTAEAMAACFNTTVELNAEAHQRLIAHYKDELNEARLKMAHVPKGAALIDNPVSAAPGFRLENVYVMAGIPSIMQAMFGSIKHELVGGPPTLSETVIGATSEGLIAIELAEIQANFVELDIGSYPFFKDGKLGVSIVIRGLDKATIDDAAVQVSRLLSAHGGVFDRADMGEVVDR